MKRMDRFLQHWRISKVRPYLRPGLRVLDIGCADGSLAKAVPELGEYVGIDPNLANTHEANNGFRFIKGCFPQDLPDKRPFDVITMMAVLEHIPTDQQLPLAQHCAGWLRPGGYLLITVPLPLVDYVLAFLRFLRLIDGMSLEQHYGYDVRQTPALFTRNGMSLVEHRTFQLGLNNLYVFCKSKVTVPVPELDWAAISVTVRHDEADTLPAAPCGAQG